MKAGQYISHNINFSHRHIAPTVVS